MPSSTASHSSSPSATPFMDSDDELDELMGTPRSVSPNPPPSSSGVQEDHEDDSGEPRATPSSESNNAAAASTAADNEVHLVGASRNELTSIQSAARRAKLHPYQQQQAENMLTMTPALRAAHLFITLSALTNTTEAIIGSAPPFSIVPSLLHNIKSFIVAVLLSSKIASYKGVTPRDHVLSLIMRDRLHIPPTFSRNPSAGKTLKEAVNHELSQARSKLKKLLKSNEDTNVYKLATLMIEGTSCTLTVPLCGRLALFRKVFKKKPGVDFWDGVDDQLAKLRVKATHKTTKVLDQVLINNFFTNILDRDVQEYPSTDGTSAPTNLLPTGEWQLGVDSLIAGDPQPAVAMD